MQRVLMSATKCIVVGVALLALPIKAQAKPTAGDKPVAAAKSNSNTGAKSTTGARAARSTATPEYHTVYQGQTLGMIAKRYNITVDELCEANGISRRSPIKPGQKLVLPGAKPETSARAVKGAAPPSPVSAARSTATAARPATPVPKPPTTKPKEPTFRKYVRPARRAGYVILKATGRRWEGYAIVKGNRLAAAGQLGFKRALYSWRTGAEAPVDTRLMRLLVQVSDTFGGRPLRIVSGFRENSYSKASKHKLGQACDFSVEGVPNEALRDYLLTLDQVGVGYYPNSSFVHLDVRPVGTQWVDRSGPGQRPEYEHHDDE